MNNSPGQSEAVMRCPGCGAALQPERVQGLCPACAWKSLTGADESEFATAPGLHKGLFEIDNHVVLEEIARGGMGIVYRARQLEPARSVALKMLLPHQANLTEMLERFHMEVQTVAALEHPGILPIYQVGEYDGIPYFTMKLAAPGTLASRVGQFRGRFREISALMASLADAVHFAHERGVLHRDLKPGNILFDEAERPYVSDFGLAKFTQFNDGDAAALTRSIQLLGTPQFLPPEIAAGGVGRATTAGDVYSLGGILYELLSGRAPFEAAGLTALLKTIVEEEPTRPTKLVASVPHDLEVICLKCLAKEPSNRYASAREFAEDLRRWLAGRPILARPVSVPARIRQWTRRNPALATVTSLLIVAILTGAILQIRTNRNLRIAFVESRTALQESLVAQAALKRASRGMGQRFDALELIRRAASLGIPPDKSQTKVALRTEMAGALALPDLRPEARWPIYVGHFEASAEFTRDLSKYACGLKDGGFGIYETENKKPVRLISGSKDNPSVSFRFSPDGEWIAAGFQDGHIEAHSLGSPEKVRRFEGQPLLRSTIEFLADNRTAVIAGGTNGVFVADLTDGTVRTLMAPPLAAFALSSDPQGQSLAAQVGNALRMVRISDGSNIWTIPSAGASCTSWSPDGRLLAVAQGEQLNESIILDATTSKVLRSFHDHDVSIGRLCFYPDGRSVASTSWDGRLVWRELAQDGFSLVSDGGPRLLRFSTNGRRLAYEPSHGEAGIYEAAQPTILKEWQRKTEPDEEVFMMCTSPDGRLAATSSARGVHLWDTARAAELSSITLPSQMWFVLVLFHPDGKSLLYSAVGIGIHQVDLIPGTSRVEFGSSRKLGENNDFMALEFAADGRSLIVGENKQSFKNERRSPDIWLWPDGDPARARKLAGDWPLVGYHLSKDSRWGLTSHTTEPDITVWDPATGKRLKNLGFADPVSFELTPDGRWIFASTREAYQMVEIGSWHRGASWPARFGQQHYRCWAFSPDSRLVAISAPNGRVELRTLPSGAELVELPAPKNTQIKALQFSSDASRLYMMTGTGAVQEWNLAELRRTLVSSGLDW